MRWVIVFIAVLFSGFFVTQKELTYDQLVIFVLVMIFYFFGIITGWYNH